MTLEDLTGRPGAYDPAPSTSRYDVDPDALAWARAKIQREIDRLRAWEQKDTDEGDPARASQWRKMANMLRLRFIGGTGCTIAAFDERRPKMAQLTGVPAPFPLHAGDGVFVTIPATVVDTPDPEDDPGQYTFSLVIGADGMTVSLAPEQVAEYVRRTL